MCAFIACASKSSTVRSECVRAFQCRRSRALGRRKSRITRPSFLSAPCRIWNQPHGSQSFRLVAVAVRARTVERVFRCSCLVRRIAENVRDGRMATPVPMRIPYRAGTHRAPESRTRLRSWCAPSSALHAALCTEAAVLRVWRRCSRRLALFVLRTRQRIVARPRRLFCSCIAAWRPLCSLPAS